MKQPRKAPFAMVVGLLILSAIDIMITLAMVLSTSSGSVYGMTD
jgi:hypothetical protein